MINRSKSKSSFGIGKKKNENEKNNFLALTTNYAFFFENKIEGNPKWFKDLRTVEKIHIVENGIEFEMK